MSPELKAIPIALAIVLLVLLVFSSLIVVYDNFSDQDGPYAVQDYALIESAINAGEFTRANKMIKDYLANDDSYPNNAYCEMLTARLYIKQGKFKEAREMIKKVSRFTFMKLILKAYEVRDVRTLSEASMVAILNSATDGVTYLERDKEKITIGKMLISFFDNFDYSYLVMFVICFTLAYKRVLKSLEKHSGETDSDINEA
ncbi:tetratricopeptide repeat protein [Fulvivirga ligni]|uniref:tetratricopeptide repeat protein n=1 Tax=Fulvivirga ligni TaxID=2904246 RepID=UPI001F2B31E4|nr:tetratricopeptide repeat protein [Fulvivirga ligni]UII20467.1 tetratricopeptide repeat protein [Fulvivirga ligni]